MSQEVNNLLCTLAGSNFKTVINTKGNDIVEVDYVLDTKDTVYEFVKFTITKVLQNRKNNDKINETIVDFKFNNCSLHHDQLRSWLLFIRYLQSTFKFEIERRYKNDNFIHLRLNVISNRTCVDDILRAYANVRIEAAKFKDRYLLDEICKVRMSDHFQTV